MNHDAGHDKDARHTEYYGHIFPAVVIISGIDNSFFQDSSLHHSKFEANKDHVLYTSCGPLSATFRAAHVDKRNFVLQLVLIFFITLALLHPCILFI